MPHPTDSSRRNFLKQGVLASSVLWNLPTVSAQTASSSDKLRLAFVGIGNRGTSNIKLFAATERTEFVAAADVHLDGEHCTEARTLLGDIPLYSDFREMLEREGDKFDAVAISTPDFAHFPVAMACMAAGKHVYLEKPLAHTFQEVEMLMEQAERTGVVTQMGNQGHSGANFHQFKAWSEAGIIKNITHIDAYMNSDCLEPSAPSVVMAPTISSSRKRLRLSSPSLLASRTPLAISPGMTASRTYRPSRPKKLQM
ncbi:MAG: Gfo/Idh/MocA family protein [Verrucomicrobiia bacterium]